MYYTRGSSDDYDGYAKISGDDGWSWNNIFKYIERVISALNCIIVVFTHVDSQHEKFVQPADNHNITGQYNASAHSTKGIVQTSLPGFAFPSDSHVINTTKELPNLFPYNEDHNDGTLLGVAWSQGTVGHPAKRSSSATSYLGDEYLNRPNMHVLVNAQVTKIIQTGTVNGLPSFHSVRFGNGTSSSGMSRITAAVCILIGSTGPFYAANATQEIIVSCGPIGTPHLLQLSGIGNPAKLSKFGIDTVINNPHVGQNITDHSCVALPLIIGL